MIVIVVPCYNEERRLDLRAFEEYAAQKDGRVEFLFVDDGSTDRTRELLRDHAVARIELDRNEGKANAVRIGLLAALQRGADYAGYWDADLATPLTDLDRFIKALDANPHLHIVTGLRPRKHRTHLRRTLGTLARQAIATLHPQLPTDTQCGAKLFRVTPVLANVLAKPFHSRWLFDVELFTRYATELEARPASSVALHRHSGRVTAAVRTARARVPGAIDATSATVARAPSIAHGRAPVAIESTLTREASASNSALARVASSALTRVADAFGITRSSAARASNDALARAMSAATPQSRATRASNGALARAMSAATPRSRAARASNSALARAIHEVELANYRDVSGSKVRALDYARATLDLIELTLRLRNYKPLFRLGAGLKVIVFDAAIRISTPVFGFRPTRAARLRS